MDKTREYDKKINDLEALIDSAGWLLIQNQLGNLLNYYLGQMLNDSETLNIFEYRGTYKALNTAKNMPEALIQQFRSERLKELNNKADQSNSDNLQD